MAIIVPPKEVFESAPQPVVDKLASGGYSIPRFTKVTQSEGGEMLSYFMDHPVPRKGLQYPEAVLQNNVVKRVSLAMFSSFVGVKKGLIGFLELYIRNYIRLVESIYAQCERVPFLKFDYYNTTSKGIWTLTRVFFTEIGITASVADRLGHVFATILEYDDAYRMPFVDVMSEFTKEEILKSPRKFIKKALQIYSERCVSGGETGYRKKLINRVKSLTFLINLALWIPKYRRAFKKAFRAVDLKLMQYDEYDYYWSLNRLSYNHHGRTIEDRLGEMEKLVNEHLKNNQT